jgi:sugar lactone lactonase YvrE
MVAEYTFVFDWDADYVPKDVEIDRTNGRVYTCSLSGGVNRMSVIVYDSSGNFIKTFGGRHIPEEEGDLILPQAVAMNRDTRDIYVADLGFYQGGLDRVQQYTVDGVFIRKWGQTGTEDGNFYGTYGIAVDIDGFVYVVDWWGSRCQKFTNDGDFVRSWDVGYLPYNVDCDSENNVYIAHYGQGKVLKYDSDGNPLTNWEGGFSSLSGVAVDSEDKIFTCQQSAGSGTTKIKKFTPEGVLIKSFGLNGTEHGFLNAPRGLAVAPSGLVYVADYRAPSYSRYSVWDEWEQKMIIKPTIGKPIGIDTQYIRVNDEVMTLPGGKLIGLKSAEEIGIGSKVMIVPESGRLVAHNIEPPEEYVIIYPAGTDSHFSFQYSFNWDGVSEIEISGSPDSFSPPVTGYSGYNFSSTIVGEGGRRRNVLNTFPPQVFYNLIYGEYQTYPLFVGAGRKTLSFSASCWQTLHWVDMYLWIHPRDR